jgi:hypothetical protein
VGPTPRLLIVPREESAPPAAPVPVVQPSASPAFVPPAPVLPEYHVVHDRLTALERLARLRDEGALTAREYAAEKAIVLGLPADELVLREPRKAVAAEEAAPAAPAEPEGEAMVLQPDLGPPLIDRFAGWKLLPVGLGAGLALSYASQPRETARFLEDLFRLLGG